MFLSGRSWKLRFLVVLPRWAHWGWQVPCQLKSRMAFGVANAYCSNHSVLNTVLFTCNLTKGLWDNPQFLVTCLSLSTYFILILVPNRAKSSSCSIPYSPYMQKLLLMRGCWIVAVARLEVSTQKLGDLFQSMFDRFCGFSQVMLGLFGFRVSQFYLNHEGEVAPSAVAKHISISCLASAIRVS